MWRKEDKPKVIFKNLLFILAIAFVVRVIPILSGTDSTDIILYKLQAYPIFKHQNIYSVTQGLFPYSPVSMFFPSTCVILSNLFRIPFYITMKIPGFIADVSIAISIYVVMLKMGQRDAFRWGLFYALNPVSILITSFHGNIMPLPVLFTFLAYAVLLFGVENNYRLSALLLGMAIGLRGYAVLLLPLFIIKLGLTYKKKIEYILYSIVPVILSFIPFLIIDYKSVLKEVFTYSGWTDYGFVAILRAINSFKNNILFYSLPNNLHLSLFNITKILFIIAYLVFLYISKKKKLIISILMVFLIFYFIYAGVASQYLIWILPFAFLIKDKFLKYYLIFTTWALTNFYLLYHPQILFGKFTPIKFPFKNLLLGEIISMTLLWLICLFWTISLMARKEKDKKPCFL